MAAKGGGSRRPAPRRPATGAKKPSNASKKALAKKSVRFDEPAAEPEAPRTFRLGVVPGATPGKWISAWRERMPRVELVVVPLAVAAQSDALADGAVDAALVRLPVDEADLHVIRLYDEVPVAVVSADSHLTAADELDLTDLEGEIMIVPADDVLAAVVPGAVAPAFAAPIDAPPIDAAPIDTETAIEMVAAGVGVVLVPMSLARLHARKDVEARPVRDAPISTVALAWPREATTADVETFVGIVRGRTAQSSR